MPATIAVIDIGKTNAKITLVDLVTRTELETYRQPNTVLPAPPYPHYDTEGIWQFLLEGLTRLNRVRAIEAISITTHGAAAALIGAQGALVLPVLDYESDIVSTRRGDYDALRPDFTETGSPALPCGLNLGAQLHWLSREFPQDFARTRAILMYPQYWAFRLSGVAASEVTSLGCHTDLWAPARRDYSSLPARLGWSGLFPPLRNAADILGPVLPEIAQRTGLAPHTPVHCGIHDSNASLLPYLRSQERPFAVVSTGTWVIAMAVGGTLPELSPARDTLINVAATGEPVPSARFMGGREFSLLCGNHHAQTGDTSAYDATPLLAQGRMLLPAIVRESGPFAGCESLWRGGAPASPAETRCAASFYTALMTATCLELTGAAGPIIVEGPFAQNQDYLRMLAAATGRTVMARAGTTGASIGAALLATASSPTAPEGTALIPPPGGQWADYAQTWRQEAHARQGSRPI